MAVFAANWKMYKNLAEAAHWASAVAAAPHPPGAEVWVFPPFTALHAVRAAAPGLLLGGQDVAWADEGAYTGFVSAPQLRDAGCSLALVAHSERRRYAGEHDVLAARKIAALWRAGLTPVYCVGEEQEDRLAGRGAQRLAQQLEAALGELGGQPAGPLVIAYEPVWAIGSGTPATPDEASQAAALIRERVARSLGPLEVRVLYGGSTSPGTAAAFLREPAIDGLLVGSASLDASTFLAMLEAVRTDG